MIHIAGYPVWVGHEFIQRCAFCGEILIHYEDVCQIAVHPPEKDPKPAAWELGVLVQVEGNGSWIVPHVDGEQIPRESCAWKPTPLTVVK